MSAVDAKRALLRDLLAKRAAAPRRAPVSFAQERLWFLDRLSPGSAFYNVEAAIPIDTGVDPDVLERAVNEIVRRHGALRTSFRDEGNGVIQLIAPELHVPLRRVDLRALAPAERTATQLAIRRERARTVFDLERGPLILTDLLALDDQRSLFLLNMHHIITDGWSMGVFSRELTEVYAALIAGNASPLAPLALQYADYAAWQRRAFSGDALKREFDYWRARLTGLQPLELPADRPRPPVQTHQGEFHTAPLTHTSSESLRAFCRTHNATPFMVLLSAFKALLARYTGHDDIAVGTYTANRDREELEPLIGFFLNTLVLRTRFDLTQGFGELVRRVRETALGAYAHQSMPFATLVRELSPERDLSSNPLVQVVFQLQNAASFDERDGAHSLVDYQRGAAIFDIAVTCYEVKGAFHVTWEYSTDLFDSATIEQMAGHFDRLLAAAIHDTERPVHLLPLMSADEQRRVLVDWSGNTLAYPDDSPVDLLLRRAAMQPHQVVFRDGEAELTLGALAESSEVLARRLRDAGVCKGDAVGVCLPRGLALPVALFGVWRAGGIYVPLDPDYPLERLAYMVEDCGARTLIGSTANPVAAALAALTRRPLIDSAASAPHSGEVTGSADYDPDAVSHIIYTSGSTGRPKAAPSPFRQIMNRLFWMWRIAPFDADEVGCLKTATSFIDSLWELLGACLQGIPTLVISQATLVDPPRMIEVLARHRVTRLWLVPSYLRALLDADANLGARLPELRFWVASGEVLPKELQRRLQRAHPNAILFNLYGTSEVWDATWHDPRIDADNDCTRVPIGRPIDNVRCMVLDRWSSPVPPGVVGELHVGGAALGSLVESPRRSMVTCVDGVPEPVWSCGDFVRWRRNGSLEFIGRRDGELKIRGVRIEPAEIEAVLMEHVEVRGAALLAWPAPAGPRLVAYVQSRAAPIKTDELRALLASRLPSSMRVDQFVFVESLPHTSSGKIDREALRKLGDPLPALAQTSGRAPRSDSERDVGAIWAELLGVEPAPEDNFFTVGGHSLLATQVIGRIHQRLGVIIELRRLFEQPTIAALAEIVDEARSGSAVSSRPIPRVERRSAPPP